MPPTASQGAGSVVRIHHVEQGRHRGEEPERDGDLAHAARDHLEERVDQEARGDSDADSMYAPAVVVPKMGAAMLAMASASNGFSMSGRFPFPSRDRKSVV